MGSVQFFLPPPPPSPPLDAHYKNFRARPSHQLFMSDPPPPPPPPPLTKILHSPLRSHTLDIDRDNQLSANLTIKRRQPSRKGLGGKWSFDSSVRLKAIRMHGHVRGIALLKISSCVQMMYHITHLGWNMQLTELLISFDFS